MAYPYLYLDSSFVSPYYKMCCDLGYPQLDINKHKDGSWSILQMWNAPLMPSYTKFNHVLTDIRHQEINESFLKRYIEIIDITRRAFWEIEEEKSAKAIGSAEKYEEYKQRSATQKAEIVKRCPTLMERIHRFGLKELEFENLWKALEPWERRRMRC